jgi:hypothetical protein
MKRVRLRRRKTGGFGEIVISPPWESIGPLSFIRREEIGECGKVEALVTCAPPGRSRVIARRATGPQHVCDMELRYFDPHTGTHQHRIVHGGTREIGKTPEKAAESMLLRADLAVAKLRGRTCHRDVRYPVKYPGFSPELVFEGDEAKVPPACKCGAWRKRGVTLERACGQGYTMTAGRTGFSLYDPVVVMLKQHGQLVWSGEYAPQVLPGPGRIAGRPNRENPDLVEKRAKKALMQTLKSICEAEEEEE